MDEKNEISEPSQTFFWPKIVKEEVKEDEEEDLEEKEDTESLEKEIAEKEIEEKEDEEEEIPSSEKLEILTEYLRNTYFYCVWCGTAYNDTEDLHQNCPGNTRQDHDD